MKIYALLVGINDYPFKPLSQCVNDVGKMNEYLESLEPEFGKPEIISLLNTEATKEKVVETIRSLFGKATKDDVALLYYSGHGAQEQTAGLFPEEHDGLLDCLVCYSSEPTSTDQFLANKEIRYVFHQLPNNPHLVTVIDSCHSGDIVRAFDSEGDDGGMIRRISGTFPAREYHNFLFAGDETIKQKTGQGERIFIPFKNHIHIAACISSESSWEDSNGGVFTRYLINLLESTQGNLSYLDIARWAKISLRGVTKKKQTPTITVQGEGPLNANSPWLKLHPVGAFPQGQVINTPKGWVFSRGSILGVKQGMSVIITLGKDEEITATVKTVETDQSTLDISPKDVKDMDFNKSYYPARTEQTTFNTLRLAINDINNDPTIAATIKDMLKNNEHVEEVPRDNADFCINLFNGFAYFSLPENDFQPLAEQIPVDDTQLLEKLNSDLQSLIKWNHFYSLDNPGKDFEECPISVMAGETRNAMVDVTNGTFKMTPQNERDESGQQYQDFIIEVKNVSKERLYVGVLTLASDMSIMADPLDDKVVELQPGESAQFYSNAENDMASVFLDNYKEVYNWKEEWLYYKVIYNNYESFSAAMNDTEYLQPALNAPLTIDLTKDFLRTAVMKGAGTKVREVRKKWGTCRTRVELANAEYNIISGDLKTGWESYATSEALAPFIKELYFEDVFNGKNFEPQLKQNKDQSAEQANRATDNLIVKFFNKLYNISRHRKFRRQKHSTGPIVVAEGDSWFLFPKPGVRDTLDYIMEEYRLLSLADAGDEISDYIKNNDLLKAVIDEKPEYVLISGGGNDILGAEIKSILKTGVVNGTQATDFIDVNAFNKKLDFLRDGYETFFTKIHALRPGVKILIHGYDYIRSNPDENTIKRGWANRYMIEAGIKNFEDREKIIRYLVDSFNDMLAGFVQKYSHVHYVNHRGSVLTNEWMDEIHPNNIGYQKVAKNFLNKMKTV